MMAKNQLKNKITKKLIVFDVGGVLVKERSCWVTVRMGLGQSVIRKCAALRRKYFSSKTMSYENWAKEDVKLWGNVNLKEIKKILDKVLLTNGAKETCKTLKNKGYSLAIISTGLNVLVERVKKELNIDYAFYNGLYEKNRKLLVKVNVSLDKNPKDKILRKLIKKLRIKKEDVVVVGDNEDDRSMMKLAGFSIVFNPDYKKSKMARKTADLVIRKRDLREILKYL